MLSWFTRQRRQKLDSLASRVAARSHAEAWASTCRTLAEFNEFAARGYIRARAGMIVTREVFLATHASPMSAAERSLIRETAMCRLIASLMAEHRQRQPLLVRRAA